MSLSKDSIKRANNAGKPKKELKEKKQNTIAAESVENNNECPLPAADIKARNVAEKKQAKKTEPVKNNIIHVGENLPYYLL